MKPASRPGAKAGGVSGRVLGAWLAILGLVVHLLAAGICPVALSSDAALASPSLAFPICHAASSDDTGGHAPVPAPAHDCPFCAAHGQAVLADAPSARPFVRVARLVSAVVPIPVSAPRRVGLFIAACPRGPPTAA